MSTPIEHEVALPPHQRTLFWRKHFGHVPTKRCGFCTQMCHIDQLGVWSLGKTYRSAHAWYCSVQCAKHINPMYLRRLLKQAPARS